MTAQLPARGLEAPHYPRPVERSADRWVHLVGLTGGAIGGLTLLGLSLGLGRLGQAAAVGLYVTCLLLMFLASAAYNLASPRRRPLLRRLDHAAIFLMIAGSYTPFTTQRLTGAWAWGMTAAVWILRWARRLESCSRQASASGSGWSSISRWGGSRWWRSDR